MDLNRLAEELLWQVKKKEETTSVERQLLEDYSLSGLQGFLNTDNRRKAFWINIYNAFFQILRQREGHKAPEIYRQPLVPLAGHTFSLDEIEHGILRRYRWKFSLGFLPHPFAPSLIRKLAVDRVDFRIHFALNCGAVSCPPIAFYDPEKLDAQLSLATASFMEAETEIDEQHNEVKVSRLLLWYLGDFGGKPGIRRLLRQSLALETKGLRIRFRDYSWEEQLQNWADYA